MFITTKFFEEHGAEWTLPQYQGFLAEVAIRAEAAGDIERKETMVGAWWELDRLMFEWARS